MAAAEDVIGLVLPRAVWLGLDERLRRVERALRFDHHPQELETVRQLRTAVALAGVGVHEVSVL